MHQTLASRRLTHLHSPVLPYDSTIFDAEIIRNPYNSWFGVAGSYASRHFAPSGLGATGTQESSEAARRLWAHRQGYLMLHQPHSGGSQKAYAYAPPGSPAVARPLQNERG